MLPKIKKFIKKNKKQVKIGLIVLIILIVFLVLYKSLFYSNSEKATYGVRLRDIEDNEFTKEEQKEVKEKSSDIEGVSSLEIVIKGRLIKFFVTFDEGVSNDDMKNKFNEMLGYISDKVKNYYDITFYAIQDKDDKENRHGHRQQGEERQLRMHAGGHFIHGKADAGDGRERLRHHHAEGHAHSAHIVDGIGHEIAGAVFGIEADGQIFQVPKQAVTQLNLHFARCADDKVSPGNPGEEHAHCDGQRAPRFAREGGVVAACEQLNGVAQHQGRARLDPGAQHQENRAGNVVPPIFPEKVPEHSHSFLL